MRLRRAPGQSRDVGRPAARVHAAVQGAPPPAFRVAVRNSRDGAGLVVTSRPVPPVNATDGVRGGHGEEGGA